MYNCCCNVATYKWKVHNTKIENISFVVKKKVRKGKSFITVLRLKHYTLYVTNKVTEDIEERF